MSLDTDFPETIFVKQYIDKYGNVMAILKQLNVVMGEIDEVRDAVTRHNYSAAREELIDTMHAAHSALRMLPGYSEDSTTDTLVVVRNKNRHWGYYGTSHKQPSQ